MRNLTIGICAVLFNLMWIGPLAAQTTTTPAPSATPVAIPSAPAAGKHYSTAETPLGELLANPGAKAVIDKHIPGLSTNEQISMASNMTLRQISDMAPDKITPKVLDDIDTDFAALPAN